MEIDLCVLSGYRLCGWFGRVEINHVDRIIGYNWDDGPRDNANSSR